MMRLPHRYTIKQPSSLGHPCFPISPRHLDICNSVTYPTTRDRTDASYITKRQPFFFEDQVRASEAAFLLLFKGGVCQPPSRVCVAADERMRAVIGASDNTPPSK